VTSASLLYTATGMGLFLTGVLGLVFCPSLVRKALALNVTGAGIFLVLVAQAYNGSANPPDPVPHGLVLTGIVIAASATALLLFLITQLHAMTGHTSLEKDAASENGQDH
jgi:multicomponent Na+:H+ antiporter subunit C